jgi:hypothetical protein
MQAWPLSLRCSSLFMSLPNRPNLLGPEALPLLLLLVLVLAVLAALLAVALLLRLAQCTAASKAHRPCSCSLSPAGDSGSRQRG